MEVIDTTPAAPQSKCISAHLRDRVVAAKVQALAAKAERPTATASHHASQEKGTTNAQIKTLTDLVKSLMKAMEEQNVIHQNQIETITKTHQNQIEALAKTITQHFDALKWEMADMAAKTEQIYSQLASIQASRPSPSYADV